MLKFIHGTPGINLTIQVRLSVALCLTLTGQKSRFCTALGVASKCTRYPLASGESILMVLMYLQYKASCVSLRCYRCLNSTKVADLVHQDKGVSLCESAADTEGKS